MIDKIYKVVEKMKTIISEFKEFIMRGNMIELAVGLVMGSAFTGLVSSFTESFLSPLTTIFTNDIVLTELTYGRFPYGKFLNSLVSFIMTAFVLFVVVKSYNTMKNHLIKPIEEPTEPSETVEKLLADIRDELKKR